MVSHVLELFDTIESHALHTTNLKYVLVNGQYKAYKRNNFKKTWDLVSMSHDACIKRMRNEILKEKLFEELTGSINGEEIIVKISYVKETLKTEEQPVENED